MIQEEFNIGSAATHKIIHKILQIKKLVFFFFLLTHNLTEYQKAEPIRISKETLLHIIFKIVTEDYTHMPLFMF